MDIHCSSLLRAKDGILKFMLIIFLIFMSLNSFSYEVEAMAGAQATSFTDETDYNSFGASLRTKVNFENKGSTWYFHNYARGGSLANIDAIVGYTWRSSGSVYYEFGLGGAYGVLGGVGYGLNAGLGFEVSGDWFVTVPLIVRAGGWSYLIFSPLIGLRF